MTPPALFSQAGRQIAAQISCTLLRPAHLGGVHFFSPSSSTVTLVNQTFARHLGGCTPHTAALHRATHAWQQRSWTTGMIVRPSAGSWHMPTEPIATLCPHVYFQKDTMRPSMRAAHSAAHAPSGTTPPEHPRSVSQLVQSAAVQVRQFLVAVWTFLMSLPSRVWRVCTMTSEEWATWRRETWTTVKTVSNHFWEGTKRLGTEIRIASVYVGKAAQGKGLSRRERLHLKRTLADLIKVIPMLILAVAPGGGIVGPILLKSFPHMLPSTFTDAATAAREHKERLATRRELASSLQDMVEDVTIDIAQRSSSSLQAHQGGAQQLNQLIHKVHAGQQVESKELVQLTPLFYEELALNHLNKGQLLAMCRFFGISSKGETSGLRTRLEKHLRKLKKDDVDIEREGIETLTDDELRAVCWARGMQGEGSREFMQQQLKDWLDLSIHQDTPPSLLLLSRSFIVTA